MSQNLKEDWILFGSGHGVLYLPETAKDVREHRYERGLSW